MKLIININKLTTRISTSKLLQNRYHWKNNFIDLNYYRIDSLKKSSNVLKRFSLTITQITHENLIESNKTNEIYDLTIFNEEEFLWKLRFYLLIKQDSNDFFWKILKVYMENNVIQQKTSLSMKNIELIFIKISQNGHDQRIIWFWQILKKSNTKLSSNCYNIILKNCPSSEYLTKKRLNIFQEMENLGYKPTMLTLNGMIRDYSKLGNIRQVKKCFQFYLKLGYEPTRKTFDYLINGNFLIKNFSAVNYFLRKMAEMNLKPSKQHVNEFIKICAMNNRFNNLQWAFEMYYLNGNWKLTSEIYDWLLLSCSKKNQKKLAEKYFNEMVKENNLSPSALTFQYLITTQIGHDGLGFHESKENFSKLLKKAIDLYKLMRREFLLSPNMFTCFTLVNSLIYNHELLPLTYVDILPELSHELLVKLQFNINPKISMKVTNKYLRLLFSALLKYKYLDEARNVYNVMRKRKYNFAIEIGSMDLIESYAKEGDHLSALQIFHEMISNGSRPDQHHYNLLLKGFFQKNDFKGGMEFYKSIELHCLIPSKEVYHTVIQALVDIKDIQQAKEIYQKLIKHHGVPNLKYNILK